MSGKSPLRLGIIGCGRMAERMYAPAIAASPRLSLAGVCDPDATRASSVASIAIAAGDEPVAHTSAADLVGSEALDVVVVTSPAEAHLEGAAVAADAGLPSLVEKPPAPGAAGAESLAGLDPTPLIAFNRRIMLGAQLRDSVPADGPFSIEASISFRRESWDAVMVRDDALIDLGPHLVDLVTWLAGEEAVEVACAANEPERADLELTTARSTCRIRCSTDSVHGESVIVRGAAGETLAERRIGGGVIAALAGRLSRRPHPLFESVSLQLEWFADHVEGAGHGDLATASEGAAVMRVLDAARASARERGAAQAVAGAKAAAP